MNWIPTFYPLPGIILGRVPTDLHQANIKQFKLANLTLTDNTRGPMICGEAILAGLPSTLIVESSGLFVIAAEVGGFLDDDVAIEFGEGARQCYEAMGEILHVHMFNHRLSFFPIKGTYETPPSYETVISALYPRYLRELLDQQRNFNIVREDFLRAAREAAQDLRRWYVLLPIVSTMTWRGRRLPALKISWFKLFGYILPLFRLLERRVKLSNVSEALYNCRGVEAFLRAFCALHHAPDLDCVENSQHREAYGTLISLYQEYGNLVGSYLLHATTILIAFATITVSMALLGIGPLPIAIWGPTGSPPWHERLLLYLGVVVSVYCLIYLLIRRMAHRFLDATDGMLEPGARPWRGKAPSAR